MDKIIFKIQLISVKLCFKAKTSKKIVKIYSLLNCQKYWKNLYYFFPDKVHKQTNALEFKHLKLYHKISLKYFIKGTVGETWSEPPFSWITIKPLKPLTDQCWPKKYIVQEPPYLMRQIRVLQWEEIKTKNSGAKHHFWGNRAQGVE